MRRTWKTRHKRRGRRMMRGTPQHTTGLVQTLRGGTPPWRRGDRDARRGGGPPIRTKRKLLMPTRRRRHGKKGGVKEQNAPAPKPRPKARPVARRPPPHGGYEHQECLCVWCSFVIEGSLRGSNRRSQGGLGSGVSFSTTRTPRTGLPTLASLTARPRASPVP